MKQYTSNNNSTKGIVYSKRDDYSYEHEDNRLLSFFIWVFTAILVVSIIALFSTITVKADSIGLKSLYAHVQDVDHVNTDIELSYSAHFGPYVLFDGGNRRDNNDSPILHSVTITSTVDVIPVDNDDIPVQDTDTPTDDTEPESKPGNPGNGKPVGNAGEKCDKGMCENTDGVTGEHGNSDRD